MVCCPFTVLCSNQASIVLPVFSDLKGDDAMNRFYSRAAEVIYNYAQRVCGEKFVRFCCTCEVEEGEGTLTVRILLSLHRRGEKTSRKTISHVWKNGYIIKKSVS